MWALRRAASRPLRGRGYHVLAYRSTSVLGEDISNGIGKCSGHHKSGQIVVANKLIEKRLFDHDIGPEFFLGSRHLSSQAGSDSDSDDDKLQDGFSDLESPEDVNKTENNEDEGEVDWTSGSENMEEDDSGEGSLEKHAQIERLEDEVGVVDEVKEPLEISISTLLTVIYRTLPSSIKAAIDKWVEEGNSVNEDIVHTVMLTLRKRKLFRKALEFAEWLEINNAITFSERDYASRVDLVAKVHGIQNAQLHVKKIPGDMQTEVVYRTLLGNCVYFNNIKKAEHIFNLMRGKGFPLTEFSCNQLLMLYKRYDKKKLGDVLLMMEKENVKPSLFTYKILINAKGLTCDYEGMDQVIENMNSQGIVPDLYAQAIIARYYINGKFDEKAITILREMEGSNEKTRRAACKDLLPLYASLGKSDDVARLWKLCEPNPQIDESIAAIVAWGKLGKLENAEAAFEMAAKKVAKLPQIVYASLLKVYAENKMLAKGKALVKRMSDDGCFIGPLTWDAIVKLYMQSGEVEKADSILHKAMQQNSGKLKPLYSSYLSILENYAQKGDVHNSEKIFQRARQAGYVSRLGLYRPLLQAYVNAKAPAYGFRERLKADNLIPNGPMTLLLSQADRIRRSVIAELLE